MDLANNILSEPVNKWVFSHTEKDTFLVGGYIRDQLCGAVSKDKDFVLRTDIRQIALSAARQFKGTFIEFKNKQTCRVAFKAGHSIDFTLLKRSIKRDLSQRDYTINAIAWSPEKGIIDPYDGVSDLNNRLIKMIDPDNLVDDPLRILRAYRLAAQLGFQIEEGTRSLLKKHSNGLKLVASERITEELIKLLMSEHAACYLEMSKRDKVLNEVMTITPHNLSVNTALLCKLEELLLNVNQAKAIKGFKTGILPILKRDIGQGLNSEGLMKLSILLNNARELNGNGYEKLIFSNSIMKRLRGIHNAMSLAQGRITISRLYDMFTEAVDCEFELALLITVMRQKDVDKYLKRAYDFNKFKENRLLNGYEIQRIIKSGPGDVIGRIQGEIQKKRFLGIITKKAEARQYIVSNFT